MPCAPRARLAVEPAAATPRDDGRFESDARWRAEQRAMADALVALVSPARVRAAFHGGRTYAHPAGAGSRAITLRVVNGTLWRNPFEMRPDQRPGSRITTARAAWLTTELFVSMLRRYGGAAVPDFELTVWVFCEPNNDKHPGAVGWCAGKRVKADLTQPKSESGTRFVPAMLVGAGASVFGAAPLPGQHESNCAVKLSRRFDYPWTLATYQLYDDGGRASAWQSRLARAVWRGRCTGKLRRAGPHLRTEPRLAVVRASLAHPHLVDAALLTALGGAETGCEAVTNAGVFGSEDALERATVSGNEASPSRRRLAATDAAVAPSLLGDWDLSRYKYIVDIDGDGCSGRLGKLLASGAVLLKNFTTGIPFYAPLLKPWVHFVPVAADLSNLAARVRWLQEHDDDARRIADAASRFAATALAPASIDAYLLAWVRAYASVAESADGARSIHGWHPPPKRRPIEAVRLDETDVRVWPPATAPPRRRIGAVRSRRRLSASEEADDAEDAAPRQWGDANSSQWLRPSVARTDGDGALIELERACGGPASARRYFLGNMGSGRTAIVCPGGGAIGGGVETPRCAAAVRRALDRKALGFTASMFESPRAGW